MMSFTSFRNFHATLGEEALSKNSSSGIKIGLETVLETLAVLEGSYGAHDVCSQGFSGYLADATCRVVIPLNNSCDDDAKVEIVANEKDNGDKKNWLSSTHFWNTNDNLEDIKAVDWSDNVALFLAVMMREPRKWQDGLIVKCVNLKS
ncbi:hypothetical protein Tco_1188595 [Tanacetum coccineum]